MYFCNKNFPPLMRAAPKSFSDDFVLPGKEDCFNLTKIKLFGSFFKLQLSLSTRIPFREADGDATGGGATVYTAACVALRHRRNTEISQRGDDCTGTMILSVLPVQKVTAAT
ncbi:hypothetical protein TKK_0012050 [Trichogramma kaykai]